MKTFTSQCRVLTLLQNFKHSLKEDVTNENGPGGQTENTEAAAITAWNA